MAICRIAISPGIFRPLRFRLADSLPDGALEKWRGEFERDLTSEDPEIRRWAEVALARRLAAFEDAGHGSCLFRSPAHAEIVQQMLIEGHPTRYRLVEWCVMPNHVHVLMKESATHSLSVVLKRWKAVSAIQINRLMSREGQLWMPDYHDRLIRDEKHFFNAQTYIRNNPVKAALCEKPEDWAYSSAGIGWKPDAPA